MLNEQQLEQAAAELQTFQLESESYLKNHVEILKKYGQLVEDYKRLRSDYEEERDSRERYKQLAKGQDRNPFVLVLVDGDGMIFDDDLVSSGAESGSRAAKLLNDVVRNSLRGRNLDHCRVMVRIYANLAGLSKALSKSKLVGAEKRSLAPFVANFNRSNELFDFVDAGELKENADFKIRAVFRQFAENAQCKHIFFAACHDVGYISELTPHVNNRDRITLVRTYAIHPEFLKLGLRVEEFPNIFRTTPLPSEGGTFTRTIMSPQPSTQHITPSLENGTICYFHQKGSCRYGKTCKNLHVKVSNGNVPSNKDTPPKNLHMPPLARSDYNLTNGNASADLTQSPVDFSTILPHDEVIPSDTVPVNKSQQRLDSYLPTASHEDRAAFQSRIIAKKLCNNFHLNGSCPNNEHCEYDHSPITPGILNCLKFLARKMPCPRRGTCRSSTCLYGHICQKTDCKYRGGKTYCKLPPQAHAIDLRVVDFTPATKNLRETDRDHAVDEHRLSLSHNIWSDSEDEPEGATLSGHSSED